MRRALIAGVMTTLAVAAASGAERVAVLEFFGRPNGEYCRAAGPAMLSLQDEFAGSAVLLEYDYDQFSTGRVDRFWAAEPSARFLPLVMVGSGYRTSSGYVDFSSVYRGMVNDELVRAPEAAASSFWRRRGDAVRCYARITNLRSAALTPAESAGVWVIVWENAHIGVSSTWVRAAVRKSLSAAVAAGATVDLVIDTPVLSGVDWDRLSCLVLAERRLGGGKYDALQAAVAAAAGLAAAPGALTLAPGSPRAEVSLDGPAVLSWTASTDAGWLTVSPAAGGLPATVSMVVDPAAMPRVPRTGTVRFEAAGDGMVSSAEVEVSWSGTARPPRRHLRPSGPGRER
jgi:hypothetical protein